MNLTKLAVSAALAGITLAGCGAIVGDRAEKRETQAENLYPPSGELLDVDGVQVHAIVRGAGPDVILIHGASGNTRDFEVDLIGRLSDSYRVIAFDRPGLGWTDRLPGFGGAGSNRGESPREQARLLKAAADRLQVRDPIIVGHSYGGTVSLAWALEHPEHPQALVLLGAPSNPWPGGLGALYAINSSAIGGATVVPLITAFANRERANGIVARIFEPQIPPEGYVEAVGVGLSVRRETLRANAQQVNTLRPHVVEMSQQYGSIDIPVEILHGDADTIVPLDIHSRPLSTQLPNNRLTVMENVGHMPHHADPETVIAAIDRVAGQR